MKTIFVTAVIFFSLSGLAFANDSSIATESATPIPKGSYRVEGGMQFNKIPNGPKNSILFSSFRYGLMHNLEIEAEIPLLYAQEDHASHGQIGDLRLKTKVRFIKGREAEPISVAGAIEAKIPVGPKNHLTDTTGEPDIGLSILASKAIHPYEAHINLTRKFVGSSPFGSHPDHYETALGVEWHAPRPGLSFLGELFGETNISLSDSEWTAAGGASYEIQSDIHLNASLGIGLSRDAPDYILNLRIRHDFR